MESSMSENATNFATAAPPPELSLKDNSDVVQRCAQTIKESYLFRATMEERCHRLYSQVMDTRENPNWSLVMWVKAVLPDAHEEYAQNFHLREELRSALDTPAPCKPPPLCCRPSSRALALALIVPLAQLFLFLYATWYTVCPYGNGGCHGFDGEAGEPRLLNRMNYCVVTRVGDWADIFDFFFLMVCDVLLYSVCTPLDKSTAEAARAPHPHVQHGTW
jgi:hypothetical protein